jgi:hypothetical protein
MLFVIKVNVFRQWYFQLFFFCYLNRDIVLLNISGYTIGTTVLTEYSWLRSTPTLQVPSGTITGMFSSLHLYVCSGDHVGIQIDG